MSGLIWAGIGRGIADAGAAYSNAMARGAELQWQEQRDEQREARAMQRAEALERLKLQIQEEQDLRDAADTKKVREAAESIAQTRATAKTDSEVKDLVGRQAMIAGDAPAASEEEMRDLLKNPQYRKIYQDAGYIEKDSTRDPRLQRAEDLATAASDVGASSRVRKSYEELRNATLKEIREENDRKADRERHDATMAAIAERGRQFDEKKPIMQQQADAATTRAGAAVTAANRPASAGRSAVSSMSEVKLNQEAETLRKAAKDATSREDRQTYEARLKEVLDEIQARRKSGGAAPKSGDNSGSRPPLSSFMR